MKYRNSNFTNNNPDRFRRGFTLIELLLVVAIIAILGAAIVIAINPGEQFEQARNASRWSHMNAVANSVFNYVLEEGAFPCGLDTVGTSTFSAQEDGGHCANDFTPLYIGEYPLDPNSEQPYRVHRMSEDHQRIRVTTATSTGGDDVSGIEVVQ